MHARIQLCMFVYISVHMQVCLHVSLHAYVYLLMHIYTPSNHTDIVAASTPRTKPRRQRSRRVWEERDLSQVSCDWIIALSVCARILRCCKQFCEAIATIWQHVLNRISSAALLDCDQAHATK